MSSGGRGTSSGRGGSFGGGGRFPRGGFNGGPPMGGPRPPYFGGYRRGPSGGPGCSCGVIAITAFVIIAVIAVFALFATFSSPSGVNSASGIDITASTVSRTKLDSKYTTSTEFYVDELGWIRNASTLNSGLKAFYNKTGVHPLLYITDTVNGTKAPSSSDMDEYANKLYDELCPDEGHILLLFHCLDGGTDYSMWYVCGAQAKTVMDSEATDILMDYIDSYFYSDKSDEEMFADAFSDAADRIMTKTTSPVVYVAICGAVIILAVLAYVWWKKHKEQKNLEAKQNAEILNADLKTFSDSDPELKDLEDKYK